MIAWTSRAAEERLLGIPFASGRNESSTPAAMVAAAKISGPGLLVRLDRSASEPRRAQLEASLPEAIRGGRLRAGERLPSSRELARALGVSRGMVQECYGQLLAEGYLTSRTGSATRVASIGGQQAGDQPAAGPALVSTSPPRQPPEPPLIADFQPGVPDLSSFPRTGPGPSNRRAPRPPPRTSDTATRAAARYCVRSWPVTCGGYEPPPALRG